MLEEGTRQFYRRVGELFSDHLGSSIFQELAGQEDKHKAMLVTIYETRAVQPAEENFPQNVLEEIPEDIMEGGMKVGEALRWLQGKEFRNALEMAISVEVNAYDRYLVLQRILSTTQAREDFFEIARQEKRHLKKLTNLLDRDLS